MRWQTVAAGALLVGLAVIAVIGFRGGEDGPTVAASAAPSPTESPSPTPSPSPSPSPSPELVLPENDVDDPLDAIVAIAGFRDHLFANPDADMVGLIYHASCGCAEPLRRALNELADAGHRVQFDAPTSIRDSVVLRHDSDRDVVVEFTSVTAPLSILTADGEIQRRVEAEDERRFRSAMTREPGGRWVMVSIQDLSS